MTIKDNYIIIIKNLSSQKVPVSLRSLNMARLLAKGTEIHGLELSPAKMDLPWYLALDSNQMIEID